MYAHMRTQTWPRSPGINVATHKSQSCCLSWCSCFAECGSKSTLMSGGAGGCAQGPVHCRWLCTCLCIACGSHSSTPHACCRTARASLHLLKRSFGLCWDAGPFSWAVGLPCMLFAFLHCVPWMWNQYPGTKRKKTSMKDTTCRSSTRSLQNAKRIYHGPKIGATNLEAGLPILVMPHFCVQNLAPALGPQNTNRSWSIRAASVPPQADSSTYPWCCTYIITDGWWLLTLKH